MPLLSQYSSHLVEAGIDEAGRGCLAGPVTAAYVILPKDYHHKLLNDSKKTSLKNRNILRADIEREALCFSVAVATHVEIDKINILNATYLAMHRAIAMASLPAELLLIDGNRFQPYHQVNYLTIVKGDSKYASIAAASILAKTYRDEFMQKIALEYPQYGWEHNASYGTAKHLLAMNEYGLSPYHRRSFKPKKVQLELFQNNR